MSATTIAQRDREVRDTIIRHTGARKGLAEEIVRVCRRTGAPFSLACAMLEQETGFRKVWGHDPPPNGGTSHLGGKLVTRGDYLAYRRRRGPSGRGGMQGVGECQLTWYAFQDEADRLGGCWRARANLTVGVGHIWTLVRRYGYHAGIKAYNGTGPAADRYARTVYARMQVWHRRFA